VVELDCEKSTRDQSNTNNMNEGHCLYLTRLCTSPWHSEVTKDDCL